MVSHGARLQTKARAREKAERVHRQEERRRYIMSHAAMMLRKGQRVGFSVDDLCESLAINKSTFYSYFKSKEDLLFTLHQAAMDDLDQMIEGVLRSEGSVRDKLASAIKGHITLQQREGVSALAIPQIASFSPKNRKAVIKRRDDYEAKIRMLIQTGINEGIFRECDVAMQSILVLTLLNSIQTWYDQSGQYSVAQLADIIVDAVSLGLLRR